MKVLYATEPGNVNPWYQDFAAALGGEFEAVMRAPGRRFSSQVRDAVGVIDVGPFFEPDMVPAAREARVRRNKDFVASCAHEEAGIIAGHQEEGSHASYG